MDASDEFSRFLSDKLKKETYPERASKRRRYAGTPDSAVDAMRITIIHDLEAPFREYIRQKERDPQEGHLIIESFRPRLESLSRETIIEMYEDYLDAMSMKSDRTREKALHYVLERIETSYSIDRWFRGVILQSAGRDRIEG